MQHPDEGTIHSWLDGALPVDEAASVESHVASCHSCAAAVAEARGFIAASSRILTALDDVPRGVVPAVPQKKRDLRVFWRAAAAMLVVAGGTLVVMREDGPGTNMAKGVKDSVALTVAPPVQPENPVLAEGAGTSASQSKEVAISAPPAVMSRAREDKAAVADERDLSARAERSQAPAEMGRVASGRIAADAAAPTSATAQIANAAPEESETALKVLKVEYSAGSRRTIYEIAPLQTVTLTEPEPVLTAATAAPEVAKTQIMLRGNNRVAPSRVEAAPAAPPPPGASFAAPANTIRWTEARTGKTLTLSGNLPVERLQEIRQRIERERAAAGTKP